MPRRSRVRAARVQVTIIPGVWTVGTLTKYDWVRTSSGRLAQVLDLVPDSMGKMKCLFQSGRVMYSTIKGVEIEQGYGIKWKDGDWISYREEGRETQVLYPYGIAELSESTELMFDRNILFPSGDRDDSILYPSELVKKFRPATANDVKGALGRA